MFYISYCDVMLKSNNFYGLFFSKGFREKCKHTELVLNFTQNNILVQKTHFPFIIVE